jgi:hypothetical protein
MAHYALLDDKNVVVQVITGRDEYDRTGGVEDWEKHYGEFHNMRCLRTSYNTSNNKHSRGGVPFRGNYAGIGYVYLEEHDIFMPPKPYSSWLLDVDTASWVAPKSYPFNDEGVQYVWDENLVDWTVED